MANSLYVEWQLKQIFYCRFGKIEELFNKQTPHNTMTDDNEMYCYYSDLPSPLAYVDGQERTAVPALTTADIDRIIEMAWEDRTPFDAIKYQFGLTESEVRKLMKEQLRFGSYKAWRIRVEDCKTKHSKTRSGEIGRFRCSRQRAITQNKISKR